MLSGCIVRWYGAFLLDTTRPYYERYRTPPRPSPTQECVRTSAIIIMVGSATVPPLGGTTKHCTIQ